MGVALRDRDWSGIETSYFETEPYRYIVIDDFLHPQYLARFRADLISHWAWRQKNWVSAHLHNANPGLSQFGEIAAELKAAMPEFFKGLQVTEHWGLMYPQNTKGRIHADIGGRAMSLWLTDDRHNLDEHTGGLVIYDVRRPDDLAIHEGLNAEFAAEYVAKHTRGDFVRIPYRCNRVVLFDGSNFHTTDEVHFDQSAPEAWRLNAAFEWNDPEVREKQMRPYREAVRSLNALMQNE